MRSVCILLVSLLLCVPALAQDSAERLVPAEEGGEGGRGDTLEQERDVAADALERLRANISAAEARQAMLRAELAEIDADVGELTDLLIRTTSQAESLATRIQIQRQRIATLEDNERGLEQSLNAQRVRIAALLSAMVRVGRAPPPALAVSPGDALRSVRSALLLGVAFPELEAESRALAADLSALADARAALDEALGVLLADAEALAEEEDRIELVLTERSRLREENQSVLERERERAALLASEASSLEALLSDLEAELDSVRQAIADAEAAAEQAPEASDDEALALLRDADRLAPAFAFGSGQGLVQRPVRGVELLNFGDEDRFGIPSQGTHIATRAGARVIAPADGWVLYAGPFRTYGQVVIIDVGDGYRMILAGMSRINVALGQFVLMGEPIAIMGERGSTVLADGSQGAPQPVLFVELREDGRPIDSSAWWAETDSQGTEG
ncbi:MAG: peptidoglycan DD-metalloendopeptidase family protein [Devosiaceae bacterium]|nr:peptidoglycan DD-metalloendopeptidase family protein [Devosiaceae bacterium MH13]